jgi:uncharacterized membrane protein YdjX (TVP38/TMEM64 family)
MTHGLGRDHVASFLPAIRVDSRPTFCHRNEALEDSDAPIEPPRTKLWRIALLAVFLVGSLAYAKLSGLTEQVDIERVRAFMESMGAWGFAVFLALFIVGVLLHVPGVVFVGAASLAYGHWIGAIAAYIGAVVSVTVCFVVVRTIGGQPLAEVKRPWIRKILARLESHPITTVAALRLILWMSPPITYALAMSPVKTRHYVVGTVLGLSVPIPVVAYFFDWLREYLL